MPLIRLAFMASPILAHTLLLMVELSISQLPLFLAKAIQQPKEITGQATFGTIRVPHKSLIHSYTSLKMITAGPSQPLALNAPITISMPLTSLLRSLIAHLASKITGMAKTVGTPSIGQASGTWHATQMTVINAL